MSGKIPISPIAIFKHSTSDLRARERVTAHGGCKLDDVLSDGCTCRCLKTLQCSFQTKNVPLRHSHRKQQRILPNNDTYKGVIRDNGAAIIAECSQCDEQASLAVHIFKSCNKCFV
jgi:hypothetical protein